MRSHEIEAWVLRIVDRVNLRQPIEDSRVELKGEWPEPMRAARRIAGLANAARGDRVLWIIGLDEIQGTVGAAYNELSNWWSSVKAQFDELAPNMTDLNVPVGNLMLVALVFETDRAPFLVKNPSHGQTGGGPVSLEVPWRDGTSVRTARRSDLLRLLSPLQAIPSPPLIQILGGWLQAVVQIRGGQEPFLSWNLHVDFYIIPQSPHRLVIPVHQCTGWIRADEGLDKLRMVQIAVGSQFSGTIDSTFSETVIDGPGSATVTAYAESSLVADERPLTQRFHLSLVPIICSGDVTISGEARRAPDAKCVLSEVNNECTWNVTPDS